MGGEYSTKQWDLDWNHVAHVIKWQWAVLWMGECIIRFLKWCGNFLKRWKTESIEELCSVKLVNIILPWSSCSLNAPNKTLQSAITALHTTANSPVVHPMSNKDMIILYFAETEINLMHFVRHTL